MWYFASTRKLAPCELQLKALRERLDSARSDETTRTAEQERPPHY